MYTINVVNKYKHTPTSHDFYCGRPSPLGNKYSHLAKGTLAEFVVESREESIKKHKEDFIKEIEVEGKARDAFFAIYDHLQKHKEVNLICWCSPQPCHCDTIKGELLKRIK